MAARETYDPDMRAFALVGAFMGFFALMESGINEPLGEVREAKGVTHRREETPVADPVLRGPYRALQDEVGEKRSAVHHACRQADEGRSIFPFSGQQ